ncbi:MAG: methyl-accepting chemotaxis protein, partial [Spirochaetes bacterium]|nr:methyl-accepting chemotaxis protein [Spirochaetota bacterium]
ILKDYEFKVNRLVLLIAYIVLISGSIVFLVDTFLKKTAPIEAPFLYFGFGILGLLPATIILFRKKNASIVKIIVLLSLSLDIILFAYFSKGSNDRSYTLIYVLIAFSAGYIEPMVVILTTILAIIISIIQMIVNPNLYPKWNTLNNFAMTYFAIIAFGAILFFVNKIAKELLLSVVNKEEELEERNLENSKIINTIKENIETLNKVKNNIDEYVLNLSKNAKDVAASVEEISATIEEWNVSTSSIAENAKITSEAMSDNVRLSEVGLQYMKESTSAFEHLVQSINKIKEAISQIFEITEQTSLISLNAAIEAARAGEWGKSFTVVAKEIQKLADKSNSVVKEIESVVNEANINITDTQEKNKRTYKIFNDIIKKIVDVSKKFESITEATEEESKSTSDIINLLDEISKNTEYTVVISESFEKLAKEIHEVSEKLIRSSLETRLK